MKKTLLTLSALAVAMGVTVSAYAASTTNNEIAIKHVVGSLNLTASLDITATDVQNAEAAVTAGTGTSAAALENYATSGLAQGTYFLGDFCVYSNEFTTAAGTTRDAMIRVSNGRTGATAYDMIGNAGTANGAVVPFSVYINGTVISTANYDTAVEYTLTGGETSDHDTCTGNSKQELLSVSFTNNAIAEARAGTYTINLTVHNGDAVAE